MSGAFYTWCSETLCPNALLVREPMPRKCASCTSEADLLMLLARQGAGPLKSLIVALHAGRMRRLLEIARTGATPAEVRS